MRGWKGPFITDIFYLLNSDRFRDSNAYHDVWNFSFFLENSSSSHPSFLPVFCASNFLKNRHNSWVVTAKLARIRSLMMVRFPFLAFKVQFVNFLKKQEWKCYTISHFFKCWVQFSFNFNYRLIASETEAY